MESLRSFIEQLKSRISIVDIIGRYVPLKPKGQNWWGNCPFHNEKTPSFSVSEERGIFKCFGCGEGGDAISFLMKKNNMEYMDAIKELAGIAGIKLPELKPRDPEEENRKNVYTETMNKATDFFTSMLPNSPAEEYLKKRKLSIDVIKKYKLGYAPKNSGIAQRLGENAIKAGLTCHSKTGGSDYDFFRNRLMFPIINVYGNTISFSGRSLDGSEPKYINIAETEFFAKRQTLFGINFALPEIRTKKRAIVVEGQIDCIQMQTHGFGETVAPLGTALTTEHILLLLKYAKTLVFCFDGDIAGGKAAARTADLIMPLFRSNVTIKFAFMADGKDPDELLSGGGDMNSIIDSAILLPDYLWQLANKNFTVMTEQGRVQADKWLRGEYEKIPDLLLKRELLLTLKDKEWNSWKKFRREIQPEIEVPDPILTYQRQIAEIAEKYPDLYDENYEVLGELNLSDPSDSGMTRDHAQKFIKKIALNKQLKNLINEHAKAEEIQKIKDLLLEI